MRPSALPLTLLLATPAFAQLEAPSLITALLPNLNATPNVAGHNTSSVLGQTLSLSPFNLTILTNSTHAMINLNVTLPHAQIGWLGIGWGTTMSDSSMCVLWPDSTGTNWTISYRSSAGHEEPRPEILSAVASNANTRSFEILQGFSGTSAGTTMVSFVRPLALPASQVLFVNDKYLNITQAESQKIIYAYSSERPASMDPNEDLTQHDAGTFGATEIDLSAPFLPLPTPTSITSSGSTSNVPSKKITRFNGIFVLFVVAMVSVVAVAVGGLTIWAMRRRKGGQRSSYAPRGSGMDDNGCGGKTEWEEESVEDPGEPKAVARRSEA